MYAVALDSSGTSCLHSRGEATLRPTVWYRLSIVRSHHAVASSLCLYQSADEDHRPCSSSCGSISSVTATLRPCERIWCHHPSAAREREGETPSRPPLALALALPRPPSPSLALSHPPSPFLTLYCLGFTVKKTYTGKLGGRNDDVAICIQLAIAGVRCFYREAKYRQFRPEN